MRIYYLGLCALLAGATRVSQAQHLRVGLKLGALTSNVTGIPANYPPTNRLFGPTGGLTVGVPLSASGHWQVQAEALYARYGYRIDYINGGYTPFRNVRLYCLDLPVLAQWHWHHLLLEAGPQVGLVLRASDEIDVGPTVITDEVRRFTAGYVAGVGAQLGSRVGLGLRFQQSLTPVYRFIAGNDFQNDLRTYSVQLHGTYYLGRHGS